MKQLKDMIRCVNLSQSNQGLLDCVEDIRPFVFLSDPTTPMASVSPFDPDTELTEEIDLPFEICSFEDENWLKSLTLTPHLEEKDSDILKISCIVIKELAPKSYEIYIYDATKGTCTGISKKDLYYDTILRFVQATFIHRLGTDNIGTANTKERIKYKNKGVKKVKVIKRIVYVTQGNIKTSVHGVSVDWEYSHRWEVRGHWRIIKGMGKNRNGDYCVPGHTWVSAFVKGDETKPLVRKTRVV